MTGEPSTKASRAPSDIGDLDPAWSKLVTLADEDGQPRTWHVLDTGNDDARLTVLCVHGNPTWSYAFRKLLATAPPDVRVIAVDQLEMGFSERTGTRRDLARRVDDLGRLTDAIGITGEVVTVAHDWGGPISLGWALGHRSQVKGVVLTNTAVHQPAGSPAPGLIRLVRFGPLLRTICERTSLFVQGTLWLTGNRFARTVRRAYRLPYLTTRRRKAIAEFVADIPLDPSHPTSQTLDEIADRIAHDLSDVPALLLWGPSDPVFSDIHLNDLITRLPHAAVHRIAGTGHLVHEHPSAAGVVLDWIAGLDEAGSGDSTPPERPGRRRSLWAGIEDRADDPGIAVAQPSEDGFESISFADLAKAVNEVGAGLSAHGVTQGDRIALMVPPGIDLSICLYACWRIGATVVMVDAGLGPRGITHALRSASPDHLIGVRRALRAARVLRWPGRRISVENLSGPESALLGVEVSLDGIRSTGRGRRLPPPPGPMEMAAVVFTSGATGPAKGVAYRHHQAEAQRDALVALYGIGPTDRLVAAFPPFALYGPAMGIASVVPEMEVTSPGTLTAAALCDAVGDIEATLVFASPAALRNVSATAGDLQPSAVQAFERIRLLLSAGAPVHPDVLRSALSLMPYAEAHTPYGMTEVLPVADIDLVEIEEAGDGNGVCVGRPLPTVDVTIAPLDRDGRATGNPTSEPGVSGEVVIRAPHMKDHYDRLWATQRASANPTGWHRSGDVGHLDPEGRLWIEGRLAHVITTPDGPVTPVAIEHSVERLAGIRHAAAVGVGPAGTQQTVVVFAGPGGPRLANSNELDGIRDAVGVDVAAALVVPSLPVDRRHNSKIDRTHLARWASKVLAGGRVTAP